MSESLAIIRPRGADTPWVRAYERLCRGVTIADTDPARSVIADEMRSLYRATTPQETMSVTRVLQGRRWKSEADLASFLHSASVRLKKMRMLAQASVDDAMIECARGIAIRAHQGQKDQSGEPYILHVTRVARAVADDPVAEAVAWVHDVKEDRPDLAHEVVAMGSRVDGPVTLLTRQGNTPLVTYYAAVMTDEIALKVKLADNDDNSQEWRLAKLPTDLASRLRSKYRKAREILTAST